MRLTRKDSQIDTVAWAVLGIKDSEPVFYGLFSNPREGMANGEWFHDPVRGVFILMNVPFEQRRWIRKVRVNGPA